MERVWGQSRGRAPHAAGPVLVSGALGENREVMWAGGGQGMGAGAGQGSTPWRGWPGPQEVEAQRVASLCGARVDVGQAARPGAWPHPRH